MNHFGIDFGTIVVSVIGGAFVYDHAISDTAPRVASSTPSPAESSPPPAPMVVASSGENTAPVAQPEQETAASAKNSSKSLASSTKSKQPIRASSSTTRTEMPAQLHRHPQ